MPIRNPALLAASLAGRPLLMRPEAVPQYAQLLGIEVSRDREPRSAFATILGRARRLIGAEAEHEEEAPAEPQAYLPIWMGEPDAIGFGWTLKDGVAVLDISGPLMPEGFGWGDCWYHGYDTLRLAVEEIAADARVGAVMTRYSSPGGVCAPGLPELAQLMRETRQAAGGKPFWAFCDYAYSAAYWLASQADQVVAPREGGVGSIGAVMTHCDISGMLSKDGIVVTPVQFGAKKTDGASFKPLSDTAKADWQAEVDQCGRWFVADVLAGRPNLTEAAVLATEAGIFYGDSDVPAMSGRAQGFVDRVMTEREAFAALRDLANATISPAAPPQPASKETEMKRSEVTAAMTAAGLTEAQIAAVNSKLPKAESEEDPAEAASDDDAPEAEAGDDTEDDGGGDDTMAGGDGTDALAPDGKTALAITGLPEAKGREKLARKLAATPGMTVDTAKDLLASASKASALAPEDPQVSTSGGGKASGDLAEGRALAAQLKSARGKR